MLLHCEIEATDAGPGKKNILEMYWNRSGAIYLMDCRNQPIPIRWDLHYDCSQNSFASE